MTLVDAAMKAGPHGKIRRTEWAEGIYAHMTHVGGDAYSYGSWDFLSGDRSHDIQSGAFMKLNYYDLLDDEWDVYEEARS